MRFANESDGCSFQDPVLTNGVGKHKKEQIHRDNNGNEVTTNCLTTAAGTD